MNVVLVPPPHISDNLDNVSELYPPIGLINIASIAKQSGHDVKIIDINWAKRDKIILKTDNWHYSAADLILQGKPDLIGLGTLCSSFPATILICKAIKKINSSIPIILGGPQASMLYKQIMSSIDQIDFILRGESDFTFSAFLDELSRNNSFHKVKGISFRRNDSVVSNDEIDIVDVNTLPFLDYSLWPIDTAVKKGYYGESIPVEAGRGCPFNCIFCSTSIFFSRKYRMKSPERITSELLFIFQKTNIPRFNFTHDLFTANKKNVLEICDELKNINIQDISWGCSARVDRVDDFILKSMKSSGCRGIFYGVEVCSDRMQKIINKNINISLIEPVLKDTLSNNLDFTLSLIVGFPQEYWSDIEKTLETAIKWSGTKRAHPQIHILAPQFGTYLMDNYGDTLSFDGRFPDRAYFNNKCSCEEMEFAKSNLQLCPQVGFFPNHNVDRDKLIAIYELTYLLLSILPGLGKFITELNISILEIFNKWILKCISIGLEIPNQTCYFKNTDMEKKGFVYIRELLNLIQSESACDNVLKKEFILFWKMFVDTVIGNKDEYKEYGCMDDAGYINITPDAVPVISNKIGLFTSRYDIEKTITAWNSRGRWEWPKMQQSQLYFLFLYENGSLRMVEVPRITYFIIKSCGNLNIGQMLILIDSLLDENSLNLKKTNNPKELLGYLFCVLREDIGLTLHFTEPS